MIGRGFRPRLGSRHGQAHARLRAEAGEVMRFDVEASLELDGQRDLIQQFQLHASSEAVLTARGPASESLLGPRNSPLSQVRFTARRKGPLLSCVQTLESGWSATFEVGSTSSFWSKAFGGLGRSAASDRRSSPTSASRFGPHVASPPLRTPALSRASPTRNPHHTRGTAYERAL